MPTPTQRIRATVFLVGAVTLVTCGGNGTVIDSGSASAGTGSPGDCGDGDLDPGETCDDGNSSNIDDCLATCVPAACGDGFRGSAEECDDGNDIGDDGCTPGCTLGPAAVAAVTTGSEHTCARLVDGRLRCWGDGAQGQIGTGTVDAVGDDEPASVAADVAIGGSVVAVAAGAQHTCAVLDTGAVRCFGRGAEGQLGYGNLDDIGDDELPSAAGDVAVGATVVEVAAGQSHTCVRTDAGAVRCWGDGTAGRLGYGNTDSVGDDETPATVGDVAIGGIATKIVAGGRHSCVLLDDQNVRCWGAGDSGAIGAGNAVDAGDDETPAEIAVVDVGGPVVDLAAGADHTCVVLDTGAVRCWGAGGQGRLGYPSPETIGDNEPPSLAGDVDLGVTAVAVAAGADHSCARSDAATIVCWGFGAFGQLGYGNTDNVGEDGAPGEVGIVDVDAVAYDLRAGREHTCVVTGAATVRCWGRSNRGQLGYGNEDTIGNDEAPGVAGDVPLL